MENKGSFNSKEGNFTYNFKEIPEIAKITETSQSPPLDDLFEDLGKERVQSLKKSIFEINSLINERQEISKGILKECEILKTEINNFLLENENLDLTDHDAILEKNNLRAKKIAIAELQLNERIDVWKDVNLLKKERREKEQELSEKENRLSTLNKILEST